MINNILAEISNLWMYAYGMIAGWGLSFSVVVFFLVLAHIRITKLESDLRRTHNQMVTESRDASLRLNKLEK
jgi:hypothetical protein